MGANFMRMDEMPMNIKARIINIDMDSLLKKKLTDMGLVQGTEFKVNGQAPLGDPIKITLRGYELAIRKNDAKNIIVEKVEKAG